MELFMVIQVLNNNLSLFMICLQHISTQTLLLIVYSVGFTILDINIIQYAYY